MPVTILDMPDNDFTDIGLFPEVIQAATESGYTGSGQTSSNPWLTRWILESARHVPIEDEASVRPWRVFQADLRFREKKFRFIASDLPQSAVAVAGSVYGNGQNLPRNSLRIDTAPAVAGFPAAGMFATIDNQLLQLKTVVAVPAEGAGVRDITFEGPLRVYAPGGTAIELVEPWVVLELVERFVISGAPGRVYSFGLRAREFFVRP